MKKLLYMMLLMGMLLTGCSDKVPLQSAAPEETTQQNVTESESKTDGQTDPADSSSENAKEPYIVSFTANTIDGKEFSSEQFSESKVTMINVWATYCNPCLAEMPDLGDIAESYRKEDFQLIGIISDVAEDASQADIDNAKDLIRQTEAEYPHLLLNQSLFDNLVGGVSSVPTTFFVNGNGEMLGYVVGANDEDTWEKIIDELLIKEGVTLKDDIDDTVGDKFDD
ncbi:MAG: TlpA family protein disulfide reductase [Lachnospiraceae bacterium]|nr:TlpA family protein disulfide reductase [Lachnospiraceae bacterium]